MQARGRRTEVVLRCSGASVGVLAITLGLVGRLGAAEAAPSRRRPESRPEGSQALVSEGDDAMEHGNFEEAIAKYTAAYHSMSKSDRAGYIGSIPVRQAMAAYELLASQKQSRELLERRLALVTEFLDAVATPPKDVRPVDDAVVRELQATRDAVEKKLAELAAASEPAVASDPEPNVPPEPDAEAETEPEREPEPEPPSPSEVDPSPSAIEPTATQTRDDDRRERPSKLAIALAATGSVVLGTGAGVLAGWWTVRNQAVEYADLEPNYEEGTDARAWYLAREEDRARGYLIAGSVVMGVGLVTIATGVGLIVEQRRDDKRRIGKPAKMSLTPSFDGRHAGLVVGGRF